MSKAEEPPQSAAVIFLYSHKQILYYNSISSIIISSFLSIVNHKSRDYCNFPLIFTNAVIDKKRGLWYNKYYFSENKSSPALGQAKTGK